MTYELFQEYPDVLTVAELQKALRVGKNKAYALLNSGEIKHILVGRNKRIPKLHVVDYVLENKYNKTVMAGSNSLSGTGKETMNHD